LTALLDHLFINHVGFAKNRDLDGCLGEKTHNSGQTPNFNEKMKISKMTASISALSVNRVPVEMIQAIEQG
jgi:hypothetical protein